MENCKSENMLIIFFINKETESCREEKNQPRLYKNVKIGSLFTRSEYSTSCIGIRNKSLKTSTETESLSFFFN